MLIYYDQLDQDQMTVATSFTYVETEEDGVAQTDIIKPARVDGASSDEKLKVTFEGILFRTDPKFYHLTGKADILINAKCDRCLIPVTMEINKINIAVNITSEPIITPEGEHEITDDEGDVYNTNKEYMDIHDILRQEIILQIPSKRLCSTSCEGIDNKQDELEKEADETTNPFNKLKSLKQR